MAETLTFLLSRIPSPLGAMLIVTDDRQRLRVLDWESHAERMRLLIDRQYGRGVVQLAEAQAPSHLAKKFAAYYAGNLSAIDDIVTETTGTPFQRSVWAALRKIPAGKTWSYSQLAAYIGRPAAMRAVGLANGSNPISLVVPCHRVIGADGSLTGYGGGMDRKKWLLEHERSAN